jgi:membrane protease subunit (stomatin/prohibitin family)
MIPRTSWSGAFPTRTMRSNGNEVDGAEGQAAVFVNEGQIADAFPTGLSLTTQNMPILTTLRS